jgi:hypothetical protein
MFLPTDAHPPPLRLLGKQALKQSARTRCPLILACWYRYRNSCQQWRFATIIAIIVIVSLNHVQANWNALIKPMQKAIAEFIV